MRCSPEWLERLTANAEVATVLGSIPASYDTVESEWGANEAVLNTVHKKISPVYFLYAYFNVTIIRIGLLCTWYAISEGKNVNSGTAAFLLKNGGRRTGEPVEARQSRI